jgi:hypothetical protein
MSFVESNISVSLQQAPQRKQCMTVSYFRGYIQLLLVSKHFIVSGAF